MTTKTDDLVPRLRKRAEIRRALRDGEPDRIADVLDEAANKIVELERKIQRLHEDAAGPSL